MCWITFADGGVRKDATVHSRSILSERGARGKSRSKNSFY